jgi:hypothetical protein
MQGTWMGAPLRALERPLQYRADLDSRRARRRLTRRDVPQCPGREVHQRVGKEHRNVEVTGISTVDLAHRIRVLAIPDRAVGRGLRARVPAGQRLHQGALDRRGAGQPGVRGRDGVVRA